MTAPVLHHHRGLFHRERLQVRHQLGFVFCEAFEVPLGHVGQDDVELTARQPPGHDRVTQHRQGGKLAAGGGDLGGAGGVAVGVLPQPGAHRDRPVQLMQSFRFELAHSYCDAGIEPVPHSERCLQGLALQGDLQVFDQCGDGPQRHAHMLANTSSSINRKRK